MPRLDERLLVAQEWVEKAESDLAAALQLAKVGKDRLADAICFHAQQCVEKYLKAVLTLNGSNFPKTHAIDQLVALLPKGVEADLSLEAQRLLTMYATTTRYPGTYEPISLLEARRAVGMARRVRRGIRRLLPRAAKARRKA